MLDAGAFYETYKGHEILHLEQVHDHLIGASNTSAVESTKKPRCIFLAGDSSLDNKHWFFDSWSEKRQQMNQPAFTAPALNGYEGILTPPRMVQDVSYWMNHTAAVRFGRGQVVCLNTSVEESTLADRDDDLLAQDKFIQNRVKPDDFVVVSVGGNDVALKPTARTIMSMALMTRSPDWLIKSGWAPGTSYFEGLFGTRIEDLIRRIVDGEHRPAKVLICMIYYLDEESGGSWADYVLEKLGYNSNPAKLQLVIRTLYERLAARGFNVTGTIVEPFPLFEVLDGKDTQDYVQRVEPSVQGGRKMAEALMARLFPV